MLDRGTSPREWMGLALTLAGIFLAGYLAAGTTETGTVAAFGGEDIPRVRLVLDGFAEGVEHWNEQKDDDVELLGGHDVDRQVLGAEQALVRR